MTSPRTIPGVQRTWSPEMDEALKKFVGGNVSYTEAAKALSAEFKRPISRNAAIGRGNRLGLKNETRQNEKRLAAVKRKLSPRPIRRHPIAKLFSLEPELERAEVVLQCAAVEPLNVGLLDLRADQCRYPYGGGPYTFCGHEKQDKSSYCHLHTKLIQGRGTPAERAAAPLGLRQRNRASTRFGTFEAA